MIFSKFPEGLLCLCLRDSVYESPISHTQSNILPQGVPVLVGQRCLNHRVGKVQKGADGSNKGNMLDTRGDSLTDDVKCPFPGDLTSARVNSRS